MSLAHKLRDRIQEKRTKLYADISERMESSGFKVSQAVQEERYNICLSCPKFYMPTRSCKVCGCFMQIKTWMANQECPIGKWGVVNNEKSEVEK